MTDLSQIIEDALDAEGGEQLYNEEDFCCGVAINTSGLADRLAATVTAHFLDREKVRAAVIEAMNGSAVRRRVTDYNGSDYVHVYRPHGGGGLTREDVQDSEGAMFKADDLIDRLIAALAGGQS